MDENYMKLLFAVFDDTKFNHINPKLNKDNQDKYVKGTKKYEQQFNNKKTPSILTKYPDKLLEERIEKIEYSIKNREIVDYGKIIGKYYDITDNEYYDTTKAVIHYDTKGNAYIVPAKPKWMLKERKGF